MVDGGVRVVGDTQVRRLLLSTAGALILLLMAGIGGLVMYQLAGVRDDLRSLTQWGIPP